MSWWQTLIVTLSSSFIGGAIAIGGSLLLYNKQQRARENRQHAEVVGAVVSALREINPLVYADRLRYDERRLDLMADKRARWLAAAGGLEVLSVTHRDSDVASLCETIIGKGNVLLVRLDEAANAKNELGGIWYDAVPPIHDAAMQAVRELANALNSKRDWTRGAGRLLNFVSHRGQT